MLFRRPAVIDIRATVSSPRHIDGGAAVTS
jgi:hypothetical protein